MRWRLLALTAATFALVTACGGSPEGNRVASLSEAPAPSTEQQAGDGSDGSDGGPDLDKMRAFAKCMREHGVDMPDPKPDGGGGISLELNAGDDGKVKAADEACRPLLPNGGSPPKLDAAQLDELRKHAQCLREHGINAPDPDPNKPGITIEGSGDPEKDRKAFQECGSTRIKSGRGGGEAVDETGPGIDAPPGTDPTPGSGGGR